MYIHASDCEYSCSQKRSVYEGYRCCVSRIILQCLCNMTTNIIVASTHFAAQRHWLNVGVGLAWVQRIRSRHGNTLAPKRSVWGIVRISFGVALRTTSTGTEKLHIGVCRGISVLGFPLSLDTLLCTCIYI